ncbi:MAG TPA: PmeII family type II restriction endonuclease [Terriglobia bacterium]|nr:PmeII family type II restriction endonuclease [Terriglobia bacterium]
MEYVNENIDSFHLKRIEGLKKLKLTQLLGNKNPYLFRAKNLNRAADLMTALLDARLSSSEEGSFGGFLEDLAVYVSANTGGGYKSGAEGIDIEIVREKIRYLIAVKSGRNWGNSSQHAALRENFKRAVQVIRQRDKKVQLQPTLGICYGKFKTVNNGEYLHIGGQSFWNLISGDRDLYMDLIDPLGYRCEEHDKLFKQERDRSYKELTKEFIATFCSKDESINWRKLVQFVSGNLP